jgi:L-lactate permease
LARGSPRLFLSPFSFHIYFLFGSDFSSSVLFALMQQQIAMDEQSQLLEAATDFAHYPGIYL